MRQTFTVKELKDNLNKVKLKSTPLESLIWSLNTNTYKNEIVDFEIDVHDGLTLEVGGKKFRTNDFTKKELGEFIKLAHICGGR